jgi:hypothetical protein
MVIDLDLDLDLDLDHYNIPTNSYVVFRNIIRDLIRYEKQSLSLRSDSFLNMTINMDVFFTIPHVYFVIVKKVISEN